jgi:hypothetical protein
MEGFAGANVDQCISIAAKVVANQEEMAKRENEKYLEKKTKILALALKEGGEGTEGQRGSPTGKDGTTLLGGTSVHTARKRDIGKMNALIRERRERKR